MEKKTKETRTATNSATVSVWKNITCMSHT